VDAAAPQQAANAEPQHRRPAHPQLHQPHRFLLFPRPRLPKHRMPMPLRPAEVVVAHAVAPPQQADSAVAVVVVARAVARQRPHPLRGQP
jgi:hypothetical protein